MKTTLIKTWIFIISFMLLVVSVSYQGQYEFQIPEIFDRADAQMFQTDSFVYGYFQTTGNDIYLIAGPESSCAIVQVWGPRTTGVINGYIPCSINLNKWVNRGWIYNFRGNNFLFKTTQTIPK